MKRFIWYLAVVALVFGSVRQGRAATIGVDGRHYQYANVSLATGSHYDTFREIIISAGHSIVPLKSFLADDLIGLYAIFLKQPYKISYSTAEINAIQDFVSGGGSAVFIPDNGTDFNPENMNALVSAFGVTYSSNPTDGAGHTITSFVSHPVTTGLSSIGVDYQLPMISINPPAVDLTTLGGSDNALAAVTGSGGSGNAVFLSDSNIWQDPGSTTDTPITFGDNALLLRNVIDFITVCTATFEVSIEPARVEVRKNETAYFTVTVCNKGSKPDSYDIITELPEIFVWEMEKTLKDIPPGACEELSLSIKPPADAPTFNIELPVIKPPVDVRELVDIPFSVPAASQSTLETKDIGILSGPIAIEVSFSVSATSQSTPETCKDSADALLVLIMHAVEVSISPAHVELRKDETAHFTVIVCNKGYYQDSYDMDITGLPEGFVWEMETSLTDIPSGECAELPLSITASAEAQGFVDIPFSVSVPSQNVPGMSKDSADASITIKRLILKPSRKTAGPKDTVVVHIFATCTRGIAGGDFIVTYDKSLLDFVKTKPGDFSGMSYTENHKIPGKISLGMAMPGGISEDRGSLLDLIFNVREDISVPDTTAVFAFKAAEVYNKLGEIIPMDTQDGSMTIRIRPCVKGDVNFDGHISVTDAFLTLKIAVGLITPTPEQVCAADVNGDGQVRSDDAILILRKAEVLTAPGLITQLSAQGTPIPITEAEKKLLTKIIAELENISLTKEQKHVLEQLKRLLWQKNIPEQTALLQNYPNPFNPETWIPFKLAQNAHVSINIYDTKGHLIRTIDLGNKKAGIYVDKNQSAYWNGRDSFGEEVASGVYFYTLRVGEFKATRKMVIME